VALHGFLYIADRTFYVEGVSVATEAAKEARSDEPVERIKAGEAIEPQEIDKFLKE